MVVVVLNKMKKKQRAKTKHKKQRAKKEIKKIKTKK
jgi:hypothetical protein